MIMAWIQTIPVIELEDERQVVVVEGEKILLFRDGEKIHAVESQCPHMNLPLKKGKLCDGAIVCPWHKSAFDLASGDVKSWSPWPPVVGKILGYVSREKALKIYQTRVESGEIYVNMPDKPSED